MNFPPAVEQWRPIIKQYFKPEDVDKALWVVMHESGGSPAAVGDGGSSLGIWQLNSRGLGAGMSAAQRANPITATKRAAEAVYGGQGWKPWGENNLYKGKKFGALGNHPFPGSSGADPKQGRAMTSRVLPVSKGRITQVFGPTNEKLDSGGVNKGLDIGVPVGTPVKSVTGGTVVHVGDAGDGWGTSVKVRDAQGNIHNYGHLSAAAVKKGASVRAGQNIAKSGNTGASTGPHLSYDVKGANGQYVDPSPWLGFNARGDNRKGHPAIGKDISEMSQESSGPWMTFWRDQVPDAQARVQSAEEQLRIIQAMPDTPGGSRGRLLELAQNQLQMAQGNLETVMMNAQAEEQNAANSQVDEFGNYIDSERVAQGWEGVAQGWAELGISEIHAQVAQGRLSLDRAVAQINERLGKQQESRARAQFVAEELDQARKWAPQEPGKTDYTGSDVSEAHGTALAQRGITPDQPVVKYSGTAQVDPQSILAQQDEYMGVGQKGSAPGQGWQEGDTEGGAESPIPDEVSYSEPTYGPESSGGGGGDTGGTGGQIPYGGHRPADPEHPANRGAASSGQASSNYIWREGHQGPAPPQIGPVNPETAGYQWEPGHQGPMNPDLFANNTPPPGHPAMQYRDNGVNIGPIVYRRPQATRAPTPTVSRTPTPPPISFRGSTPPPEHPAMRRR